MSDLVFGRDRLGELDQATRLEWLVTNGIGGHASGTVGGALTRREHGLLVAALDGERPRTLLLAKLSERIEVGELAVDLDTNRWRSGAISPAGHAHLESFRLEGSIPVWTWSVAGARLEKRVWMEHGENTTYVQYRLAPGGAPARLVLRALVNDRPVESLTTEADGSPRVEPVPGGLRIEARAGGATLWLFAPGAEALPASTWYRGYSLALETARGEGDTEDHLLAGEIRMWLDPGDRFTVAASTRHDAAAGGPLGFGTALARRQSHDRNLIGMWTDLSPRLERGSPAWVRQLVLAADTFILERSPAGSAGGRGVVAGYPGFEECGRDALAALPGLTLATGRPEIARGVLSSWVRLVDQGLLPGRFTGQPRTPVYDSADASLWFFRAVRATYEATRDEAFLAEMYPALEEIGAWYERGTRDGIGVDPQDGLIRIAAGEEDLALTWMDARAGGRPVTPRKGKPVELNALWYNALTAMADFARRLNRPAEPYQRLAARVERAFERYWNAGTGWLCDLIDGPEGPDPALRPNQILAVSLPDTPLPPARRRAVLEACGRWLLTSHGLRSLWPADFGYRGRYAGGPVACEAARHQGTAFPWLLPHYALAHFRVHGDRDASLALLEPFGSLIGAYGVGYLPALANGNPPHAARGAIAHAWAVGEALRAWQLLSARAGAVQGKRAKGAVRAKTAV